MVVLCGLPTLKIGRSLAKACVGVVGDEAGEVGRADRNARSWPPPAKTVSGRPARACWTKVGITKPPARDWRGPPTLNGRITKPRRPRWRLLIVAASVSVLAIAYSSRAL